MYIVDTDHNELVKAESCTFKSLNLRERQHLQEWIAKDPSVLGEDLLIIQKEFDGFSDTHERLDLLAIDKQGNLVIIENKLDDSGRDVTWQAIKYASYCSSLSLKQIIEIFGAYLAPKGKSAEEELKAFFDVDELEEVGINQENTQRIFFVAANFRKEVTSSVLWLRDFGIDVKCFKVSPFRYGGKIMVDFDQIIPIKDTEEFTIKMAEKKKEEKQQEAAKKNRNNGRFAFWQKFIAYNQENGGEYAGSAGTPDSWLGKGGIGINGVSVNICIAKESCRSEIYINTGEKERNKKIFDFYFSHRQELESELDELYWERLDDRVTCRISQSRPLSYQREEDYNEIFDFFIKCTRNYIAAFGKVSKKFKA